MENITKDDIRRNIGKSANKLKNYLYVSSHKIFASIENMKPGQGHFYRDEIHEIFFDFKLSVEVDMGTLDGISEMITKVNDELNDYFKMTFDGMDFVSFHVRSFIFPPEKTNEDKFFEVFGKTE